MTQAFHNITNLRRHPPRSSIASVNLLLVVSCTQHSSRMSSDDDADFISSSDGESDDERMNQPSRTHSECSCDCFSTSAGAEQRSQDTTVLMGTIQCISAGPHDTNLVEEDGNRMPASSAATKQDLEAGRSLLRQQSLDDALEPNAGSIPPDYGTIVHSSAPYSTGNSAQHTVHSICCQHQCHLHHHHTKRHRSDHEDACSDTGKIVGAMVIAILLIMGLVFVVTAVYP